MKYICSNLASDNCYTTWIPAKGSANDLPRKDRQVVIKGGTGLPNKNLITPYGVVTPVDDDQYKILQECPSFVRHKERGFIRVLDKNPSESDKKKISNDLNEDNSSPVTPEKLQKEGKKSGKTTKK